MVRRITGIYAESLSDRGIAPCRPEPGQPWPSALRGLEALSPGPGLATVGHEF